MKGLTSELANSVCLLPSFMHRLEGFLLVLQLRHTLPQSLGASPVPPNLVSFMLDVRFSHLFRRCIITLFSSLVDLCIHEGERLYDRMARTGGLVGGYVVTMSSTL